MCFPVLQHLLTVSITGEKLSDRDEESVVELQ